jgi:hypothetical protein
LPTSDEAKAGYCHDLQRKSVLCDASILITFGEEHIKG